jgi:hypothetical protein
MGFQAAGTIPRSHGSPHNKDPNRMPLYTVMTQDGLLSDQQRDVIAAELVRIHTSATGVPANFVHSIFPTYPKNHAYFAAERSAVASIVGVIRAGRPPARTEVPAGSSHLENVPGQDRRIRSRSLRGVAGGPAEPGDGERDDHAGDRAREIRIAGIAASYGSSSVSQYK